MRRILTLAFLFSAIFAGITNGAENISAELAAVWEQAAKNGLAANEGFERCLRFVNGWLNEADKESGLIPRNLKESRDFWNAQDSAADNYPFMVLTAAMTNRELFGGRMLQILQTERKLTSRIGHLPAAYSFSKKNFRDDKINHAEIIFGSAEYMKDGLIPITEYLGKSEWSERMMEILDDLDKELHVTPELIHKTFGYTQAVETSGDMLQVLSRMYRMTGNQRYWEWAIQFGDYYLNEERLPTRKESLRLRDHGCEIIGGLTELYAIVHEQDAEKKKQYQPFIHEMLDTILAKGRNEDGLFYNGVNPLTGKVTWNGVADTWGYTLDAVYTVYLLDGKEEYQDAVLKALRGITKYKKYNWENGSSDGYADSIESALNLYFFEPLPETAEWIDGEIKNMWNIQKPSGIIEGWHGDGNFARTTLMYCLWKTGGVTLDNWNKNIVYGSVIKGKTLYFSLTSTNDWTGHLTFEPPLHQTNLHLPLNYPRINQFQEWFPIEKEKVYSVTNLQTNQTENVKGEILLNGYPVKIFKGEILRLAVKEL